MITYSTGNLGLSFILRCKGSVFPKAVVMAAPSAILALLLHMYMRWDRDGVEPLNMNGVDVLWTGYTSVLGFLIVFRNNQAYTRFWEGATLIHQVRGEWFNAASSIFAFCTRSEARTEEVKALQHTLIRLFSMLYCSGLQQVCDLDDDRFEIIEIRSMEAESIDFMKNSNDRCEVILQWIQRMIVDAAGTGVLDVPAPLLTRALQELSGGIVNLNNARKIKEIPFPFPYAQMITCMLLVHWVATPFIASQVITSRVAASVVVFFVTFVVWCLVYIAMEIDQPFGDDPNDLPLHQMQRDFNHSLLMLMHPMAQHVPTYTADGQRPSFSNFLQKVMARSLEAMPEVDENITRTASDANARRAADNVLMASYTLRQPSTVPRSSSHTFSPGTASSQFSLSSRMSFFGGWRQSPSGRPTASAASSGKRVSVKDPSPSDQDSASIFSSSECQDEGSPAGEGDPDQAPAQERPEDPSLQGLAKESMEPYAGRRCSWQSRQCTEDEANVSI